MKFSQLANYFSQLEKTTSRNEMTEILARLFKKSSPNEIDKICYLCLGRLVPLFEPLEFNLAEKMMIRVLAQAYRREEKEIREKYKQRGDLGDTAAFFDHRRSAKPLSITRAYERLKMIAEEAGEGSVERKIIKMAKLLDDLDRQSAKYVVRIPLGRLRLGFSDMTILDALSWMLVEDKSKRNEIEAAYQVRANVGQIAKLVKKKGLKGLEGIKVQIGTPVMPALCQRLGNAKEMIKKMEKVAVEPKYDGARLQVHFSQKKVGKSFQDQPLFDFQPAGFIRTFTRNLENTTHMFPDLAAAVFKEVKAQEAILDCEAVGFDPKTGKLVVFQQTMKRKRKHQIGQTAQEIPLHFYCFDVLYKDGQDLLSFPFSQRRRILSKMISPSAKVLALTPQIITSEPEKLRRFHHEQIKKGLEGAVVKKWQAPYDPGRRGYTWVKFKQEKGKKGAGLSDTLDCLVMGYYSGKGKRAEFGVGRVLVGIRKSEKKDEFLTLTKVGTGPSDEQWVEMKKRCDKLRSAKKPKQYHVDKNLMPDTWCRPGLVIEVEADNITQSPIHLAGYSLRFARWLRFRDDKTPFQVTTLQETKKLYKLQ